MCSLVQQASPAIKHFSCVLFFPHFAKTILDPFSDTRPTYTFSQEMLLPNPRVLSNHPAFQAAFSHCCVLATSDKHCGKLHLPHRLLLALWMRSSLHTLAARLRRADAGAITPGLYCDACDMVKSWVVLALVPAQQSCEEAAAPAALLSWLRLGIGRPLLCGCRCKFTVLPDCSLRAMRVSLRWHGCCRTRCSTKLQSIGKAAPHHWRVCRWRCRSGMGRCSGSQGRHNNWCFVRQWRPQLFLVLLPLGWRCCYCGCGRGRRQLRFGRGPLLIDRICRVVQQGLEASAKVVLRSSEKAM